MRSAPQGQHLPRRPVALRIKLVELNRPPLWGLYRAAAGSSWAKALAEEFVWEGACGCEHRRIDARCPDDQDSHDVGVEDLRLRRSRMNCSEDERCG